DRARPARMDPPAELRGEQWTRPDYGGRPVTVTPAAPTAGPHHDVQPLLDLAVVMAESDDVEAILELATAAVPTLAPGRCGGVRGPGAGPPPTTTASSWWRPTGRCSRRRTGASGSWPSRRPWPCPGPGAWPPTARTPTSWPGPTSP